MVASIKIEVDAREVNTLVKPKPKEIARANRLTINKIVDAVHKDVGGLLPRGSGVQITGFRRVRTRKTRAKARSTAQIGSVWIGGNDIAARFAGRPRQAKDGAFAGKHFFKGSFVATMKSGMTSVFERSQNGKIKEATVQVKDLDKISRESLSKHSRTADKTLKNELEKILNKRR